MNHISLIRAKRLLQKSQYSEALTVLETLVKTQPTSEVLSLLAETYFSCGKYADAIIIFEKLVQKHPNNAQYLNNLGVALEANRDLCAALDIYSQLAINNPDYQPAHYHLGNLLQRTGDLTQAKVVYESALKKFADHIGILNNLAIIYLAQGNVLQAIQLLSHATLCSPTHFDSWLNCGYAYYRNNDFGNAQLCYARASQLSPRSSLLYNNLGLLYLAMGDHNSARNAYLFAISLEPGYSEARHNLGLLALEEFKFSEGWEGYQHRPSRRQQNVGVTSFNSIDLFRKSPLLVVAEQGIGDEFFYMRFFVKVKEMGLNVKYFTQSLAFEPLKRMLGNLVINVKVDAPNQQTLLLGDLPYVLGMSNLEDIPPAFPLTADPTIYAKIKMEMSKYPKPWVGITWRAGSIGINQLSKTIPLRQLIHIFQRFKGSLFILQRLPSEDELNIISNLRLQCTIVDKSSCNVDLEVMLALLALLDDYIAVSNTNVHLRNGLGLPSKVLVPWPPEWRWGNELAASPWFRHCSVYRENKDKQWVNTIEQLENTLAW